MTSSSVKNLVYSFTLLPVYNFYRTLNLLDSLSVFVKLPLFFHRSTQQMWKAALWFDTHFIFNCFKVFTIKRFTNQFTRFLKLTKFDFHLRVTISLVIVFQFLISYYVSIRFVLKALQNTKLPLVHLIFYASCQFCWWMIKLLKDLLELISTMKKNENGIQHVLLDGLLLLKSVDEEHNRRILDFLNALF